MFQFIIFLLGRYFDLFLENLQSLHWFSQTSDVILFICLWYFLFHPLGSQFDKSLQTYRIKGCVCWCCFYSKAASVTLWKEKFKIWSFILSKVDLIPMKERWPFAMGMFFLMNYQFLLKSFNFLLLIEFLWFFFTFWWFVCITIISGMAFSLLILTVYILRFFIERFFMKTVTLKKVCYCFWTFQKDLCIDE